MKEAIAPIAVLCTHYISSGNCSFSMISNELYILFIGSGIGLVINLFYQDNRKTIRKKQFLIEERMKSILERMAFYITKEDKTLYTGECFGELNVLLADLREESIRYTQNHFFGEHDYFYSYMQLRLSQGNLLRRIYRDITRIDIIPEHAKPIADFLSHTATVFHETNNAVDLKERLILLNAYYDQEVLPATREEFQNRALLFHILKDLEEFVDLKYAFMIKTFSTQKS